MHLKLMYKVSLLSIFLVMVLIGLSHADDPPLACFTTDVLTGDIPLVVNFDDASIGDVDYWTWDFGDGTPLLTLTESGDTQHTYTTYNTFNVTLTVYGYDESYTSATTQIVTYAPLVAGFSQLSTPGTFPLEVSFTDESTGDIVGWAWDFGDESPISYVQNPVHTYTSVGDFIVTLTVTDSSYATAQATELVVADEVWTPDSNGHLNDPNGAWRVALVSAGFKSKDGSPNWHIIHRDKGTQEAYTEEPFSYDVSNDKNGPQWWDRTTIDPNHSWPDGDAIDLKPAEPDANQTADDREYPICYTSGAYMKVKLTVKAEGVAVEAMRGFQVDSSGDKVEGAFEFPETDPENGEFILECTQAFKAGEISYFEKLNIMWQAKINGKWGSLVPSKNQCYVTLVDPIPSKIWGDVWVPDPNLPQGGYMDWRVLEYKLFHTCLHHGCEPAKGKTSAGDAFDAIWNRFKYKAQDWGVLRAEDKYQLPSTTVILKYYHDWEINNYYTDQMLRDNDADGQCHAWATFFIDTLKVQGIQDSGNLISAYLNSSFTTHQQFIVNDWDFTYEVPMPIPTPPDKNPHNLVGYYQYSNVKRKAGFGDTKYEWVHQDVVDTAGIAGQGGTNPASLFMKHFVVKRGSKYYDPSYGKVYDSFDDLEEKAIAGYWRAEAVDVSEAALDTDLNGDNDKNDVLISELVEGFAKNEQGSGNSLSEKVSSY